MTTWSVNKVVEKIRMVQESKGDMIIVVSGFRGVGKSSFTMQVSERLIGNGYFTEEGFDKHNIYAREELNEKLESFPNKSVINVDEAINLLFKREFMKKEQNQIIKKFNTYRNKYYVIFLLIPNFWDLDRSVRNSTMIKWWIHLIKWGEGYIYQADENEWNPDPWNQKNNYIARAKGVKRFSLPNYVSNVNWQEVPQDIFNMYEKVKARKRKASYGKITKKRGLSKKELIVEISSMNKSATHSTLAKALGTETTYVQRVLRQTEIPAQPT